MDKWRYDSIEKVISKEHDLYKYSCKSDFGMTDLVNRLNELERRLAEAEKRV